MNSRSNFNIIKIFKRYKIYIITIAIAIIGIFTASLYKELNYHAFRGYLQDLTITVCQIAEIPCSKLVKLKAYWHNQKNLVILIEKNSLLENKIKNLENAKSYLQLANQELKKILKLTANKDSVLTVPCFGQYIKLNTEKLFIHAGKENNIKKYNVVLGSNTIIGQIDAVNLYTARVILLTDPNFKLAVFCQRNGNKGILSGYNKKFLILKFIENWRNFDKGDLIFSSGTGGYFPRGYLVGKIYQISEKKILVQPVFSTKNLHYVQVMRRSNHS